MVENYQANRHSPEGGRIQLAVSGVVLLGAAEVVGHTLWLQLRQAPGIDCKTETITCS